MWRKDVWFDTDRQHETSWNVGERAQVIPNIARGLCDMRATTHSFMKGPKLTLCHTSQKPTKKCL